MPASAAAAEEEPSAAPAATDAELVALDRAKERWRRQRARDYTVRIEVVNRKPRGTPQFFRQADTAKELFEIARRALDSQGEHSIRYLPRGLPRLIASDPIVNAVDDEHSYRVSDLRITRPYPAQRRASPS
jgi:hypothetical protein